MTLNRLRQIGWASLLLGCTALFVVLWVQVNSVKSDVRMAEREIVRLQNQKLALEMEFQTRANQSQLAAWNAVDFGYEPPAADQFLDGEQALAEFGVPRAEGAPDPIRVAQSEADAKVPEFPKMVSPVGEPEQADLPAKVQNNAIRLDFGRNVSASGSGRVALKATLP
ncbi:hypothetical protein VCJ71_06965 [Alteriqipengyuania sp. WL0013]|uniref:hypothetical protein n=1 Tax=Alteriqipengyuania sp. WL0013 TaxID=3110773 RepID=UPI002C39B8BD|nr:hypothetical protein [Alteriqipengyuania sp. WL0013]MEB3415802.1 hypothetical protein [Alteriqipengyuania sp. WL0013]